RPGSFEALVRPEILLGMLAHVVLDQLMKAARVGNRIVRRKVVERRVDLDDVTAVVGAPPRKVRQHRRAGDSCKTRGGDVRGRGLTEERHDLAVLARVALV